MTQAVHPQRLHPESHSNQVKIASGLNVLAGVYLLVSSWIGLGNDGGRGNNIIFGIIVAVLAAFRFSESIATWGSWLNALIGIWIIISPWAYGYNGEGWMWNSIVVGIIVLVLGVWSARATETSAPPAP